MEKEVRFERQKVNFETILGKAFIDFFLSFNANTLYQK